MTAEAIVLSTDQVDSLKRVSKTYNCALVDDDRCVEAGDGDYDLEVANLPDGRRMYEFNSENPPKVDADDGDGATVLKLMHRIEGSLWFKSQEDFDLFAIENEGVAESDGYDLGEVEPLFTNGELAKGWFTTGLLAD